jgi:hypothetical protein
LPNRARETRFSIVIRWNPGPANSILEGMIEVLAILGLLGWLLLALLEWLRSLSVFPAIVIALVLCPVIVARDYFSLIQNWQLSGMVAHRDPIPPERFYWSVQHLYLRRRILFFGICSALAWLNAATLPASLNATVPSLVGWLNAAAGIITLGRAASSTILFFNASQWFDAMRPKVVGILRHAMYRLSDNYEYLAQKRKNPEKEEVY